MSVSMGEINFNQLGELRLHTTERLASLLESRIRTEAFSEAVSGLVKSTQSEITQVMRDVAANAPAEFSQALETTIQECSRLNRALEIFLTSTTVTSSKGECP